MSSKDDEFFFLLSSTTIDMNNWLRGLWRKGLVKVCEGGWAYDRKIQTQWMI
jgi:hypothetical protein